MLGGLVGAKVGGTVGEGVSGDVKGPEMVTEATLRTPPLVVDNELTVMVRLWPEFSKLEIE